MVDNELTSTSPPQKENRDENPSNAYINPIVPKKYKLMTSESRSKPDMVGCSRTH